MFVSNQYFNQGHTAFQAGLPESACPLLFDAPPRKIWLCGWQFGYLESLPDVGPDVPLERVEVHPYEQGQNAHKKGIAYKDCPYDKDSWIGGMWRRGWTYSCRNDPNTRVLYEPVGNNPFYDQGYRGGLNFAKTGVAASPPPWLDAQNLKDWYSGYMAGLTKHNVNRMYGKFAAKPTSYPDFITNYIDEMKGSFNKRIEELLAANNREVERRRVAEEEVRAMLERFADDGK